ncbi:MAG: FapA family protein [Thermoanaerobacteraceae bacterium]|nr:FapA family protein [Thermoanaerobacteraceae bacterium]
MARTPVRVEAPTVEEALRRATDLLGASREDLEVEVLDEGARGFWGLGRRPAVIRAWLKVKEEEQEKGEGGEDQQGLPEREEEAQGYGRIQDGRLLLEGGAPVVLVSNPHFELYVNGQLVEGEAQVTAGDAVEIKGKEEWEQGKWEIAVREEGLVAVVSLFPTRKRVWKLVDQPPSRRLELKGKASEELLPPVTWEQLQQELQRQNIVYGLDYEALQEVCRRVDPGEVVIARGKPALPPQDAWIEYFFDLRETSRREVGEEERVDYRELVVRSSVQAGDVLAIWHPGQPGEAGVTVTGQPILPRPPKEQVLVAGRGTALSDDGGRCVATAEGRPVAIRRGSKVIVEVTPVLIHQGDVNLASGNLKFKGNIVISGSITETMTVVATRDVEVNGDVTQATVQAGGSILVRRNAIGSTLVAGDTGSLLVKMAPLLSDLSEQLARLVQALTQLENLVESRDGYVINVLIENKFKRVPELIIKLDAASKNINTRRDGEAERLLKLIQTLRQSFRSPASRQSLTLLSLKEMAAAVEEMALYCREVPEDNGHVTVNYALNTKIQAQGDVKIVGRGCFNTEIVAGGNVEINGVFRAGNLYAEGNVFIQEMGSSGGARTVVRVAEGRTIKVGKLWPNCVLQIGRRIRQIDGEEHRVMAYLSSEGEITLGTF